MDGAGENTCLESPHLIINISIISLKGFNSLTPSPTIFYDSVKYAKERILESPIYGHEILFD